MTTSYTTDSGERLEAWLKANKRIGFDSTVAWLKQQDALCKSCITKDGMLCSGVRQVFDEQGSVVVPMMVQQVCPKLNEKLSDTRIDTALVNAGFGAAEASRISAGYTSIKGIRFEDGVVYRGDTPYRRAGSFSHDNRLLVGMIACNLLVAGHRVWHIPCAVAARALQKDMTIFELNENSDLVIVSGIEDLKPYGTGDVLLDFIDDRIATGRPVWVRVPKLPLTRADQTRASAIMEELTDVFL